MSSTLEQVLLEEQAAAQTTSQKVALYYRHNKVKGMIEKVLKPINEELKAKMIEHKLERKIAGDYEIVLGSQDKSTVNEEKLLELLHAKRLTRAIKKIEKPDEEAVERLVAAGKITAEEFASCITSKVVQTLQIREVKRQDG